MSIAAFSKIIKSRNWGYIVSFIIAWTILALHMSAYIDEDNLIYAIGEIHTYDASLFSNNVYLGGAGSVSPRFLIDHLFASIMRLNGGSWADCVLMWIYFGMTVQAAAIANISYRISEKYQNICSAIFTCMLTWFGNNLAGFRPIAVGSTSLGPALAIALLAISFIVGKNKNYNLAWVLAGCATICHIHEGIYCCAVIFAVAAADCIFRKRLLLKENRCILIAICAAMLVVLPNMLTDKMDISNDEFVYIYSVFRHPHHLVPTAWGDAILKSGWINIFAFLLSLELLFFLNKDEIKRYALETFFLEVIWLGALLFAYVFTEKIPLAFISTLFLPKVFKYVVIVALILLLKAFIVARNGKLYLSGYLLLLFAWMTAIMDLKQIVLLFLFTAITIMIEFDRDIMGNLVSSKAFLVIDMGFFALFLSLRLLTGDKEKTLAVIAAYLTVLIIYAAGLKTESLGGRILGTAACICLILFSVRGRIIFYDHGSLEVISGERVLKNTMGDEAFELAAEFREKTGKSEEFMADPNDTNLSGWFQVVSERNCYVVKKAVPSSKNMIDDWYERYVQTDSIFEKEPSDIVQIMNDSNIDYILVKRDYFEKFDYVQDFIVFLEGSQDSLRIYRLKQSVL